MVEAVPHARLVWAPQAGPQAAFLACPMFEVVYGGARGGGKTDATLGEFLKHQHEWRAAAKGLFIRRKQSDLVNTLERAKVIYGPAGARWNEAKSTFTFPSGAVIRFRYLDRDEDAERYQGQDYSRVIIEELTQFPTPGPVNKLKATLRSAEGAPCGFRATCNPGGPGHGWVKARYIDNGPWKVEQERYVDPFTGGEMTLDRVFIPARLTDNAVLLQADPLYVAKLQQTGSETLVRAWLEGDWNQVEGAFFDRWGSGNIVRTTPLPAHWTRFRSFDWGSARPFSVGWWAVASDAFVAGETVIPRGALVRYREWYGSTGKPNEGLKLTAEQVAEGILARDSGERIAYAVADPSIFHRDGGPSIGERMARAGVVFRKADNTRVAGAGAVGGWDQMRARILGDGERPMLFVFDTCRDFLRTVPALGHDPDRPEDLDTRAEDHVADEARYACMSRPYSTRLAEPPVNPPDLWGARRGQGGAGSWKAV
ncbi:MAG: terminase family protein [Caulobacteraceae bacterium]